jgi:hypothetical protein
VFFISPGADVFDLELNIQVLISLSVYLKIYVEYAMFFLYRDGDRTFRLSGCEHDGAHKH